LALLVLEEELGGLWNKIAEMTDDQVAELSEAMRKAMGKNDVVGMTSLGHFQG
jgi:hypothetical protein